MWVKFKTIRASDQFVYYQRILAGKDKATFDLVRKNPKFIDLEKRLRKTVATWH
ncbi:MAG: hypothetical protein K6F31_03135 [Acetatifactor sp.]|nr:hypothetical protein [Acetatifactor sp.]